MNLPAGPSVSLETLPAIEGALAPGELRALGAALVSGFGTGHRSMLPLAVHTWRAAERGALARILVTVLAGLELVGDKLPMTPDRRRPLLLAERIAAGAVAGLAAAPRGTWRIGRALGAAAAAALGAYAGANLRRRLTPRLGPLGAALTEDALTFGMAWLGARLARPAVRAPR